MSECKDPNLEYVDGTTVVCGDPNYDCLTWDSAECIAWNDNPFTWSDCILIQQIFPIPAPPPIFSDDDAKRKAMNHNLMVIQALTINQPTVHPILLQIVLHLHPLKFKRVINC